MNEFEARQYILGKELNSTSEMQDVADEVIRKFSSDYGSGPRAVAAFITKVANLFCREMSFTGFQAGFIPLDFLLLFTFPKNKCGIKVLDYDNLLYPQLLEKFTTISKETWDSVVKQARINLKEKPYAADEVRRYWDYIARGKIPDGIRIK